MNNEILERVGTFKYLGLMLDSELNFEAHISYTYKKACSKLTMLRKTRICMNQKIACQLYKSLILPQLDYCDVVYMTATKGALKDLQKVQNICCRVILKESNKAHVQDMHNELKLIPLEDRRALHLSQLCHKGIYEEPRHSLSKFFKRISETNRRPTRTRNQMNMQLPKLKSSKARLGFAYRGPSHWNHIENEHKLINNYNSFKTAIYKRFKDQWDNHPT